MADPLDGKIYGEDTLSDSAQAEAGRALRVPTPTLDVWDENDSRATTEGNHGKQS